MFTSLNKVKTMTFITNTVTNFRMITIKLLL